MKGHFAYLSGYLICGGCGGTLCPYTPATPLDNEYTFRVYCGNPNCPCYLDVYEPSDKFKVSLIPTRLKAPDPRVMTAGTGGLLGTAGVMGQAQATQVTTAAERARLAQERELETAARAGRARRAEGWETTPGIIPPLAEMNNETWHTFTINQPMRVDNPREHIQITGVGLTEPDAPRPR